MLFIFVEHHSQEPASRQNTNNDDIGLLTVTFRCNLIQSDDYVLIQIYNKLPAALRAADSIDSFKTGLK